MTWSHEDARLLARADELSAHFWPAVLPLLSRERAGKRPDPVGSGVLIMIADEMFLLTAAHVLTQFDKHILTPHGEQMLPLHGTCLHTPARDPIDAGIIHLDTDITALFAQRAVELTAQARAPAPDARYLLLGYPASKQRTFAKEATGKRKPLVLRAAPATSWEGRPYNSETHTLFPWSDWWQNVAGTDNAWDLHGASGGGIWELPRDNSRTPRLMAIFTERTPDHKLLVGTRIGAHLELAARACPRIRPFLDAALSPTLDR